MFAALLALLGGWRGLIQTVALGGAVMTLGYYVYEYDARGREIVQLQAQLQIEQANVKVEKANVALRDASIDVLNEHLGKMLAGLEASCEMLMEIATSKDPAADKQVPEPIAGVLGKLKKQGD